MARWDDARYGLALLAFGLPAMGSALPWLAEDKTPTPPPSERGDRVATPDSECASKPESKATPAEAPKPGACGIDLGEDFEEEAPAEPPTHSKPLT